MQVQQSHGNILEWEFDIPTGVTQGTVEGDAFEAASIAKIEEEISDLSDIIDQQPDPENYSIVYQNRGLWLAWTFTKLIIRILVPYGPFIPLP